VIQSRHLPEGIQIDGISAMESITGNGTIKAQIEASEEVIDELKNHLEFVEFTEHL
jgi:hypothetical protein